MKKYPVTAEDLKQIPNIVKNYDNVYVVENASGRNGIYYVKRHNGTTYYLEQVVDANKQMIKIPTGTVPDISELKNAIKNRDSLRFPNGIKAQQMYVQDVDGKTISNSIISNSTKNATPTGGIFDSLYQDYSPNGLVQAYQNGTLSNAQIETLKPGGVNRAAFELAAGVNLPDTSSKTRSYLKSGDKDLNRLDINTASWENINSSKQFVEARNKARFETSTIADRSPQRQALLESITNKLMQSGSYSGTDADGSELFDGLVNCNRRADIVIGPPAAGKSSVLANPISGKYGSRIIDSDNAKNLLPEFEGGYGASRVHEESDEIKNIILANAVANDENIVIPIVGKTTNNVRSLVNQLKAEGYTVNLSLNELDADKAARRSIQRFVNTGRFVDPEYVKSVGLKPSKTYDILKQKAICDGYTKYSNDVPKGSPARFIESTDLTLQKQIQDGGMGGYGRRNDVGNVRSSEGTSTVATEINTQNPVQPAQGFSYPSSDLGAKTSQFPTKKQIRASAPTPLKTRTCWTLPTAR